MPSRFQSERERIRRQRMMAEMLKGQSMAPIQNQSAGGFVVPTTPLQGVAKLAQAGFGVLGEKRANKAEDELEQRRQSEMQEWIQSMPKDRNQMLSWALKGQDFGEVGQAVGGAAMSQAMTPTERNVVEVGDSLYDLDSNQWITNPDAVNDEPLMEVVGDDGNVIRVPRSQAIGMRAPKLSPEQQSLADFQKEQRDREEAGPQLTPAQKKVDEEFAKDYNEFVAQGGFSDVEKQVRQLEEPLSQLEAASDRGILEALNPFSESSNISGPGVGAIPDFARPMTIGGTDAVSVRESIEEVVQRNLRLILGPQFTEREGERLISRAFNKSLPEEENAKRLRRLMEQIRSAAKAKMEAVKYYEENGTLKGFEGKAQFTIDDFDLESPQEESNIFDELPDPAGSMKDKIFIDDETEIQYRSDGTQWVPINAGKIQR